MARKGHHRKPDPSRECEYCGRPYERTRYPCGYLEGYQDFVTRKYCSKRCNLLAMALARRVRREQLRREVSA